MTRPGRDDGNASIEFVYLAILLMVPLVYLVLAAYEVQRTAFGVAEASRQAGRAYVTASGGEDGLARALFAADLSVADQGLGALAPEELQVSAPGGFCAGGEVTVVVRREVRLPLIARLTSFAVSGEHTERIDPYRSLAPCG